MAKNENTTTLAVNKECADNIRAIARKEGMDVLDLTNQLLNSALQNGIEFEVQVKKVRLKPAALNAN